MHKQLSPSTLDPAFPQLLDTEFQADRRMDKHVQGVWNNCQKVPCLPSSCHAKSIHLQQQSTELLFPVTPSNIRTVGMLFVNIVQ